MFASQLPLHHPDLQYPQRPWQGVAEAAQAHPLAGVGCLAEWLTQLQTQNEVAAECDERSKWLEIFVGILKNTTTPVGLVLQYSLGNIQFSGTGRRAGTLRSWVRTLRKFLARLACTYEVPFPADVLQLTEYRRVRLSELCNRDALKMTHESFACQEEVTGVEESDRLSDNALNLVAKKELLSSALPGRRSRQAPRFPTTLLSAL